MAYPGKILAPHTSSLVHNGEAVPWLWKDGFLFKNRRVSEEAKQMCSRNMIQQEDLSAAALPSTDTSNLSGPNKYAQIGGDGAGKLLRSALVASLHVLQP